MIFRVITITLLTICTADNKIILPLFGNTPALPPQRFNRHDLPAPFKFGESRRYSSASPVLRPGPLVANPYQRIQYAPLHGRISQKNKNAAAEYTKITPTLSSAAAYVVSTEPNSPPKSRNSYGRDHLEPRVPTGPAASESPLQCYSPGHNIQVLSSVSRSPGHNAIYRTFLEPVQRDKSFKNVNYMRPYGPYHNSIDMQTTTSMPFELPHENLVRPFSLNNQYYALNPNSIEPEGPIAEKIKRQYSPYSKYHRLHLNIARVYSPGQVPPKSPVFADTYSLKFGRLPVQAQAYVPPVFQPLPDEKTVLYPAGPKANLKKYRLPLT